MIKSILFLLVFISIQSTNAQENYPKPTPQDVIFYIQHNRGKNTFIYQPNYSSPLILDDKAPIIVSRQMFDSNGSIKPLTPIQRKYAYGIKSKKINTNYFEISIASYPEQKLYLKMMNKKAPYVEANISGKYIIIDHLFIDLKEGTSGLNTKADYITFYGKDKNGKPVIMKIAQ